MSGTIAEFRTKMAESFAGLSAACLLQPESEAAGIAAARLNE